ncbi:C-C motif chemokine 13-like protein [Labeo rohita]|uniref:C-C motif chemokine 13-like protein n=1 Tax=Labeo rohita TaxID=84645 RepID=A0A498MKJ9_LABRO|nr:C-C motif chemokine 13-like protein [Labeo rohita]
MKTFMKTSLVFLMLCCALQLNTSAGIRAVMSVNSICCFKEINIRIPLKRLVSYLWTSNSCPFKHIVFVTAPDPKKKMKEKIRKNLFCMDPEYKWVRRAINYLDKKRAKNSTQ